MTPKRQDRTNTLLLVFLLLAFMLLCYYTSVSFTSKDPLWILKSFSDKPSRIIVYHAGQRTELQPGQTGFDELANAVETTLTEGFARLSNLGLSGQSLQDAYTQFVTLEVFWSRPIELHTWFPSGRTTQMLFPITGRHSEMSVVLLGDKGKYRAGAPVLDNPEIIRQALKSLGYY